MKIPRTFTLTAVCIAAVSFASSAYAGEDKDKHFAKMDANGDGRVTRAEHASAAKQMFTDCDANADGRITAAEMDKTMAKMHGDKYDKNDKSSAEKIQMMDKNNDGQLTASEHDAGAEMMFSKMDTDSDGSLTMAEVKEGMKMKKKDT